MPSRRKPKPASGSADGPTSGAPTLSSANSVHPKAVTNRGTRMSAAAALIVIIFVVVINMRAISSHNEAVAPNYNARELMAGGLPPTVFMPRPPKAFPPAVPVPAGGDNPSVIDGPKNVGVESLVQSRTSVTGAAVDAVAPKTRPSPVASSSVIGARSGRPIAIVGGRRGGLRAKVIAAEKAAEGTHRVVAESPRSANVDGAVLLADDKQNAETGGGEWSNATNGANYGEGKPDRFPQYGTPAYSTRCSWLLSAVEKHPPGSWNCTFHYGLAHSRQSEGISYFFTQLVSSHLFALQAGCKLIFDYGRKMDIHRVIAAPDQTFSWAVPEGYNCDDDPNCYRIPGWDLGGRTLPGMNILDTRTGLNETLASVPRYRQSYGLERFRIGDDLSTELERVLPGFNIGDGMACSLGSLLTLAPTAAKFEPGLFTEILPALRDEDALVIGVYARTGWTDLNAKMKRKYEKKRGRLHSPENNGDGEGDGLVPSNETTAELMDSAWKVVNATLDLERKFLTGKARQKNGEFKKIVWMVTTDWPHIKSWVAQSFDGADANEAIPKNEQKFPDVPVPRRVITTLSRGAHTRLNDRPKTADFAHAFLDWYLLGETDAVVKWRYSFAETAALRRAVDVYQGTKFKPLLAPLGAGVAFDDHDGSIVDVDPRDLPKKKNRQRKFGPGVDDMQRIRLKRHK